MPIVKTTLAEIAAKPLTGAERAQLAALSRLPDSSIDFSDQEEITAEKVAAGRYIVTRRGGARPGAGRKPSGKVSKQVRLSPATIAKLQRLQKRRGLPSFSAAIEEAVG
jgi:hypothetical protein